MAKNDTTITIDGKEYETATLDKSVKAGINNLRAVDAELQRLKLQTSIAKMARDVIAANIKAGLPK